MCAVTPMALAEGATGTWAETPVFLEVAQWLAG
jgi:hypothetical protein